MSRRSFTERQALAFIERVGFCWLFGQRGRPVASLWEAMKGRPAGIEDWDEDAERMWAWKDEFPRRGLAFYGKLVARRPTFVSLQALPWFLADRGREDVDDYRRAFEDGLLGTLARDVAAYLEEHGPTPSADLRRRFEGRGRKGRVDRALEELQVHLLVTHYGIHDRGGAWPGAVYELVARAFPVALEEAREWAPEQARQQLLALYRQQFPSVPSREVSRLLGWRLADVQEADIAG